MSPILRTALTLTLACVASSALAQTSTYTMSEGFGDLPPLAQGPHNVPPRKMAFELELEIPLPGPLPGSGPRIRDGQIEIDVAGGRAVTGTAPGSSPVVVAGEPAAAAPTAGSPWVEDEAGRRRFRVGPAGRLEAERRCPRCKRGWKRSWRLRVPGDAVAAPLVAERRVYYGALDNRVYCVRARNGHRVWAADIGGRVSAPLGLRDDSIPGAGVAGEAPPPAPAIVLAVPDGGTRLVALDAATGVEVASLRLETDEGKLVSGAVATGDGRVVVARQRYLAADAALLVYRLAEVEQQPAAPTAGETAPPVTAPAAGSGRS